MNTLHAFISQRCSEKHISISRLADMCNISSNNLMTVLNEKRKMSIELRKSITDNLDLNEYDIKNLEVLSNKSNMNINASKHCSLCNDCKRATGYCSWSLNFEPVQGWKADKKSIHNYKGRGDNISYFVKECPLFISDADETTEFDYKRG